MENRVYNDYNIEELQSSFGYVSVEMYIYQKNTHKKQLKKDIHVHEEVRTQILKRKKCNFNYGQLLLFRLSFSLLIFMCRPIYHLLLCQGRITRHVEIL